MDRDTLFRILSLVSTLLYAWPTAQADQLDTYVKEAGKPSHIEIVERSPSGPVRVSFQSHVWREIPWRHELIIEAPTSVARPEYVALLLTGGKGGDEQRGMARALADQLGIRAAVLTQVPNQALFGGKKEDDLLSFTLDQYRRSGETSWPLLFPMVASVVKGIDVLEEVLERRDLRIILVGASKRGWTTYLTGAVDKRVAILVPAVFEMISIPEQVALARSRYGKDSEKIRAYTELGLTDSLTDERVKQLVTWLDPISYTGRLTAPKLVLLGANDPYWVADSVRRYWHKLPSPKMLRTLPNVGHSVLKEPEALRSAIPFIKQVLTGKALPEITWNFAGVVDGQSLLSGSSNLPLDRCVVWRAVSIDPDIRDDRFESSACTISADGRNYSAKIALEENKIVAAFAELETALDRFVISTETHVFGAAN